MAFTYLEFERPIAELSEKIEELSRMGSSSSIDIAEEVEKLSKKRDRLIEQIYRNATRHQIAQLSRHPDRPYFMDYIPLLFEDFQELHGDRAFADDAAIVGGPARFGEHSVMIVGHQKGRDTKEKIRRNFGMARPEGYRKALRLFRMAERFGMPVMTFIDTAGAWPGIDAEEHGQSEAIARNLMELAALKVPVICTVIGEGGSGGALALGVGDRLYMQEFTTYSVISPEGCAAILWRDRAYAEQAAEALKPTVKDLQALGLVDGMIPEPRQGAHRDLAEAASLMAQVLHPALEELLELSPAELLRQRQRRLRDTGVFPQEKDSRSAGLMALTWQAFLSHLLFAGGLCLLSWWITRWMVYHTEFLDIPNERSSHDRPTPRGGGISIVAVFLIGLLMIAAIGDRVQLATPYFVGFLLAAYSIALLSFLDDIHDYPFQIKLTLHCVAIVVVLLSGVVLDRLALPLFGLIELGALGYLLTFLWLLGLTNAYNFMDGIDGLAASTAIIVCAFFAYITFDQGSRFVYLASYTIIAGSAGFLLWNRPPAKIFMGDIGSTFLGFTLGCMALIAARYDASHTSFLVMPLLLLHFIFDTMFTMARRIREGENPARAHRTHIYQLLVRMGLSHGRVTLIYALCAVLQGLAAIWMMRIDGDFRLFVFLPFFLCYAVIARKVVERARRQGILPASV